MVNYFYIESNCNEEFTVILRAESDKEFKRIEFSEDGVTWKHIVNGATPEENIIPTFTRKDQRIYFRGSIINLRPKKNILIRSKSLSGKHTYNIGGDITTVLAPEGEVKDLSKYVNCFNGTFYDESYSRCEPVVDASNLILPSLILSADSYRNLFNQCTTLIKAPKVLPATTLTEGCYQSMFEGCTLLKEAPKLPATNISDYCYSSMFYSCTSLEIIPDILPAMTLVPYCYSNMFDSCESIKTAPKLPSTELADSCYSGMFMYCTSLTQAPELPAMTLAPYCYSNMFEGCTSLRTSPKLLATELAEECYLQMFSFCDALTEITALYTDESFNNFSAWFSDEGLPTNGIFYKNPNTSNTSIIDAGIPDTWTIKDYGEQTIETIDCFYITSKDQNEMTVKGQYNIEYSTDNKTWKTYSGPVPFKGKLYLRGDNETFKTDVGVISCSIPFSTYGNITSLLKREGGDPLPSELFVNIFKDCNIDEVNVKGNNLTNRAQTYVYDNSKVKTVILHILNKDKKTYSEWRANINEKGKLINLVRIGLVK